MPTTSPTPDWFPHLPWFGAIEGIVYYDILDALCAALLPEREDTRVLLGESGRLLGNSIQHLDILVDESGDEVRRATGAMATLACHFEAALLLARLFPPTATFWATLRKLLVEHARATIDEHRYASGKASWEELTPSRAEEIAIGKNAVARAMVAAVAELTRCSDASGLDRCVLELSLAAQAIDDAADWRIDLPRRLPSLVVARLFRHRPDDLEVARTLSEPELVRGPLAEVLTIGWQAFARGRHHPVLDRSTRWCELMDDIDRRYRGVVGE